MRRVPSRFKLCEVWLEGHRSVLTLRRCPPYLRFTVNAVGELDALDQLDDAAESEEQVVAAERVSKNPCHIKYGGKDKHKSGFRLMATYRRVEPQPADEVMRDRQRWQAWCVERWSHKEAGST